MADRLNVRGDRWNLGLALLATVAIAMTGCGSTGSASKSTSATTTTAAVATSTASPGSSVVATTTRVTRTIPATTTSTTSAPKATVPVTTTQPEGDHGPTQFESPSHNIGCYIDSTSARCDIRVQTWTPPPAPANCDLDWGGGLEVGPAGKGGIVCAGDTVMGGTDVLGYGQSSRRGNFRCVSTQAGMTCVDVATKHGFDLSKASYRVY